VYKEARPVGSVDGVYYYMGNPYHQPKGKLAKPEKFFGITQKIINFTIYLHSIKQNLLLN
jgi:hypothetical protein